MISDIKSKYILKHALNYIPDRHYELKLFSYSKNLQNKYDISYSFCYEKYLNNLTFYLDRYLYEDEDEKEYKPALLIKEYDNFISKNKLNKNNLEKMIIEIINNKNESGEKIINIDSPLFDIFSKAQNFDKNCTICIIQRNIDKYKLKYKYSGIFNKLNDSNIKYSSIYYIFERKEKIDYLKELNINFNNIKKLHLQYNSSEK